MGLIWRRLGTAPHSQKHSLQPSRISGRIRRTGSIYTKRCQDKTSIWDNELKCFSSEFSCCWKSPLRSSVGVWVCVCVFCLLLVTGRWIEGGNNMHRSWSHISKAIKTQKHKAAQKHVGRSKRVREVWEKVCAWAALWFQQYTFSHSPQANISIATSCSGGIMKISYYKMLSGTKPTLTC